MTTIKTPMIKQGKSPLHETLNLMAKQGVETLLDESEIRIGEAFADPLMPADFTSDPILTWLYKDYKDAQANFRYFVTKEGRKSSTVGIARDIMRGALNALETRLIEVERGGTESASRSLIRTHITNKFSLKQNGEVKLRQNYTNAPPETTAEPLKMQQPDPHIDETILAMMWLFMVKRWLEKATELQLKELQTHFSRAA